MGNTVVMAVLPNRDSSEYWALHKETIDCVFAVTSCIRTQESVSLYVALVSAGALRVEDMYVNRCGRSRYSLVLE